MTSEVRVFLTGGTGLLGSHVAQRLLEGGNEVVALHRRGSDTTFLRELGCDLVEGDLLDEAALHTRRMKGCQGVVHGAAYIYGGPSLEAVRRVNVEGTRRVLEGAREAGVPRVVHLSSVVVYGDPPSPITEETPLTEPLGPLDFYGVSKREGDLLAQTFHQEGGMSVTVLRPPAIYGERDRLLVPKLATFLKRRVLFLLGSGRTTMAAVYAGNVAQAVEMALVGRGGGGVFNVTEDVPLTLRDLYLALGRALRIRPLFVCIPAPLARLGAGVGEKIGITIPGARELPLTRVVRLATENNPYPPDLARKELGWDPPFSLGEALDRTGIWVRDIERVNDGE